VEDRHIEIVGQRGDVLPATTEDDDMDELVKLVVALSEKANKVDGLEADLKDARGDRNQYRAWGEKMFEMLKETDITPPNHWSFSDER
jgi:hypothetical protein